MAVLNILAASESYFGTPQIICGIALVGIIIGYTIYKKRQT